MVLDETKKLNKFLDDIETLQKRSKLLEIILGYYNPETLTFEISKKWGNNIRPDKLPAETPFPMA